MSRGSYHGGTWVITSRPTPAAPATSPQSVPVRWMPGGLSASWWNDASASSRSAPLATSTSCWQGAGVAGEGDQAAVRHATRSP